MNHRAAPLAFPLVRSGAVTIVVVAALVLAGCSGDVDDPPADDDTTADDDSAADDDDTATDDDDASSQDLDQDGWDATEDCDDSDPALNLDDADGDHYDTCDGDCDDADPAINPGEQEICGDQVDSDCDGSDDAHCTMNLSAADARLLGEAALTGAGAAVAPAGDVDGDGIDDLLVGAPYLGIDVNLGGAVHVVHGPVSGDQDIATVSTVIRAAHPGDAFGSSVAAAGDTDADGHADIVVGAPSSGDANIHLGTAYLFTGPIAAGQQWTPDAATATVWGSIQNAAVGTSVASAGDVDGDGHDDLLFGAERYTLHTTDGAVYLFRGPVVGGMGVESADAAILDIDAGGVIAGLSVAHAGDTDGDGFDDVLFSAPAYDWVTGAAMLFHGPLEGEHLASDADVIRHGGSGDLWVGTSIAGVGDVDDDGLDDILVSAMMDDEGGFGAGAAYLVPGPMGASAPLSYDGIKFVGAATWDSAGTAVAGAGDANADGHLDLLVSAPIYYVGIVEAGAVYLLLGPFTGDVDLDDADYTFVGEEAYDHAGMAIAGAMDLNDDGCDDVIIGAPEQDSPGEDAGVVYVVYGRSAGLQCAGREHGRH